MTTQKNIMHRKIGGVKLINTGLRGIEIIYETVEIIDGVSYNSEDTKKSFRPAHHDLKDFMKDLRTYLIELCGYDEESVIKADFEITGVKAGSDSFLISGKFRCWNDKIIAVNTPLIKEVDAYERFDEVMTIVDKIYKETDMYLKGVKKADRKEIIVDYMKDVKKNNLFTYTYFEEMTPEEQEKLMNEIEKDMGISVKEEEGKMVLTASEEEGVEKIGGVEETPQEEELPVDLDNEVSLDFDDIKE